MRNKFVLVLTLCMIIASLTGCNVSQTKTSDTSSTTESPGNSPGTSTTETLTMDELISKAKAEGTLVTLGMPDNYANWGEVWAGFEAKYGIKQYDTDMDSASTVGKMAAEGENASADMGAIGFGFGSIAHEKGIMQPYKSSYWNEIPDWAKDDDGYRIVFNSGVMSFLTNKNKVKNPPKSWAELLNGDYKVSIGDVTKGAQAQMAVLAAAYAFGGDENNLEPGIKFFETLAKQGRLSKVDLNYQNIEKGETEVALLWDYNSMSYREKINHDQFDVSIPSDGSVISGDLLTINKYAKHPYAAKLAVEYILSDEGQTAFANGYVRPIRSVEMPKNISNKMLQVDADQKLLQVKDPDILQKIAGTLPLVWQERVLLHLN